MSDTRITRHVRIDMDAEERGVFVVTQDGEWPSWAIVAGSYASGADVDGATVRAVLDAIAKERFPNVR